jgi:hypothetical protein
VDFDDNSIISVDMETAAFVEAPSGRSTGPLHQPEKPSPHLSGLFGGLAIPHVNTDPTPQEQEQQQQQDSNIISIPHSPLPLPQSNNDNNDNNNNSDLYTSNNNNNNVNYNEEAKSPLPVPAPVRGTGFRLANLTVAEVSEWLRVNELGQYAEGFAANQVDGRSLAALVVSARQSVIAVTGFLKQELEVRVPGHALRLVTLLLEAE